MYKLKNSLKSLLFISLVALLVTFNTLPVKAMMKVTGNDCSDVLVIFARGSGQNDPGYYTDTSHPEDDSFYEQAGVTSEEKETARFFKDVSSRINPSIRTQYESLHNNLDRYNQYGYTAVDVSPSNFLKPAQHRKDVPDRYYESVRDGAEELAWSLEDSLTTCPSQQVVLGGYSQGAEVVGDALNILQAKFFPRIAYIALFGDPKFTPYTTSPGHPGSWKRGNSNAYSHGILDTRFPYLPNSSPTTGSWCASGDEVCDAGSNDEKATWSYISHAFHNPVHSSAYTDTWIDKSMSELMSALNKKLPNISPTTNTQLFFNLNDKSYNMDLAVVIDTSSSMASKLGVIRANVNTLAEQLLGSYWQSRVAIVAYNTDDSFSSSVRTPLTSNPDLIRYGLSSLQPNPYSDTNMQYHGIYTAINDLDWEKGAQKKIIVITDSPASNDSTLWHITPTELEQMALDLDPAVLNLADVSCDENGNCNDAVTTTFNQEFATESGGDVQQIYGVNQTGDGGTTSDLESFIGSLQIQPAAEIDGDTTGYVGTPLILSADMSYDPNEALVNYQWDCNNDGVWDVVADFPSGITPTTDNDNPNAFCTYAQPYDGLIVMRVTSESSETARATLPVHIMVGPAPVAPSAPEKPNAALTYGPSSMNLSWGNQYGSDVYIKVADDAGNLIGYAPADTPGVTLSGIGGEVPALHVSACTDAGGCSEPTAVPLDRNVLEAMTVSDVADTFAVQEAVETPQVATTSGTEQNESATPNTPTLKTAAVFVPGEILTPNAFSDFISSAASSVLGDTTTSNIAKQFEYHAIAATSTTKNQNQPLSLKWRLIIGVPAIVLGVALLVRYFYVRKKS